MSNRPPGGYILIGVTDDGKPCMPKGTIADRRRFDGAKLGDLVRRNIEGQVNVRAVVHDHEDREIVLIFVEHSGLPVPFSKVGQHPDPSDRNRQIVIFRPGDIFVREGAQNVPIRHAHWPDVLLAYTKQIRDEATDLANTMMREFIDQFRQHPPGSTPEIPLLMEMDEATFANAVAALIEANNDARLRQFLRTLSRHVNGTSTVEDCELALNKWAIFCAQATIFERDDLAENAIDALYEAYRGLRDGPDLTRKRLAVVVRIYTVGSLAIRMAAWETVHSLAIRPVPTNPSDDNSYVYASWIRHSQVDASRAGLTRDEEGNEGFLISAARALLVDHPTMRPDVGDDEIPPVDEITVSDVLLNTLCQFDIAYCVAVAAREGSLKSAFYPSSAAFDEDRAKPITLKIVDDPEVRRRLFPDSDDESVAGGLALVYDRTIKESQINYGGRWWSAPQRVNAYIDEHGPFLLPG